MGNMKNRRSFVRKSRFRDANLIVIACEGYSTEVRYFEELISKYAVSPSRIHIEIIVRDKPDHSAPEYVLQEADKKRKESGMLPGDEFWIIIDYDRWKDSKIASIAQQAYQKGYLLGLSNPCFEAWLLLHWIVQNTIDPDELEKLRKKGCTAVAGKIREIRGHYNKNLNDAAEYMEHIERAITNARSLDTNPDDRWPHSFGSRVYLLCERIIKELN
jgi:hypothetical protein